MEGTLSYTPLNMTKLETKYKKNHIQVEKSEFNNAFNTTLLALATLTALIMSIILFLLIKKQVIFVHG